MAKIYRPTASATHTIVVQCDVTSLDKVEEVKRKQENGGNSQQPLHKGTAMHLHYY